MTTMIADPQGNIIPYETWIKQRGVKFKESVLKTQSQPYKYEQKCVFYDKIPDGPILVKRDNGMGDAIMFSALIRELSLKYKVPIDVASYFYADLFLDNPYVRNRYKTIPKNGEYFAIIDGDNFTEEYRQKNRIDEYALLGGIILDEKTRHLDYYPKTMEKNWAQATCLNKDIIVYVWQGTTPHCRSLGNEKNIANLQALRSGGYNVVVLFNKPVNIIPEGIVNLTGKTSLREACAIVDYAKVVITPDTGLTHIAQALDKKIVTYFNVFPMWKFISGDVSNIVNLIDPLTACPFGIQDGCSRWDCPCGGTPSPNPCLDKFTDEQLVGAVTRLYNISKEIQK